jgi:perosamine synthetase
VIGRAAPEERLAVEGGRPVRETLLPYGHQSISEEDIAAVANVLRSDWLTTGPEVERFERAFADYVGAEFAVAFSSGTAALHGACHAAGIAPLTEAIVPTLTFCASANCVLYQGGAPVLVDVNRDSGLISASAIEHAISERTRAIIVVDYTGQPADLDAARSLAENAGALVIEDASHSLGAVYKGRKIGTVADLTTFSLHPVKHITSGEGGVVTTTRPELAERLRAFRNHGIQRSPDPQTPWSYSISDLGFNYRLTDIGCALAASQLRRLDERLARRKQLAVRLERGLAALPGLRFLERAAENEHAWHLFVVALALDELTVDRPAMIRALREEGIGVNVHYIPLHLQPLYRTLPSVGRGEFPNADWLHDRIVTLPLFDGMSDGDADDVVHAVTKVIANYSL